MNLSKNKTGGLIFSLMLTFVALIFFSMNAYAEALLTQTYIDDGGIPPAGTIKFISYYSGNDLKIQTEDSQNDSNNNAGYVVGNGTCTTQPGNMNGDQTGQSFTIEVSRTDVTKWGKGVIAALPGAGVANTVPGSSGSKLPLINDGNYVGMPQNARGYIANGRVVIKWDAPAAGTPTGYRVYRRPSATEGATEIIFDRRGTPTTMDLSDPGSNGQYYAYIICAYNATGFGPHTDEILITPDAAGTDPAITVPTPNSLTVGSPIVITGTNFGAGGGILEFNGAKVTIPSGPNWTNTSISVTVPAGTTTGNLYVISTSGRASNAWAYTISGPVVPAVTSVTKNYGYNTARTVVITGSGFTGAVASFDATAIALFTVNSDTTITATIAAGQSVGVHNIRVANANGTSPTGAGSQYTVVGLPTVTIVTPSSGLSPNTISITGTNLLGDGTDPVTVEINGVARTFTQSANNTTITNISVQAGLTPGNSYRIIVRNPVGPSPSNAPNDLYTISSLPSVTLVSPNSGVNTGTTTITITGTNLTGATAVNWGATSIPLFTAVNATTVVATVQASLAPATDDIRVTTPAGQSPINAPADQFTVTIPLGPTVTNVSPNSGDRATKTPITITGTNFTGATWVHLVNGGTLVRNLTNFVVMSATSITAEVPAMIAQGTYEVRVNTLSGTSPLNPPGDEFTVIGGGGGVSSNFQVIIWPNPYNPNAGDLNLVFSGANPGDVVEVYILDTNSRVIWQEKRALAPDTITWDGYTQWGEMVDNGLYLLRAVHGGQYTKGKILVVKK